MLSVIPCANASVAAASQIDAFGINHPLADEVINHVFHVVIAVAPMHTLIARGLVAYGHQGDGLDVVAIQVADDRIIGSAAVKVVEGEEAVLGLVIHAAV